MASPPIPPLLGSLAARPFSFYPPIVNVEHNEWVFRRATWSELVVVNHKTADELSIPRHFIADVSSIDHPIVIVGLNRQLEYRDGAVWPYERRVIEMPVAVGNAVRLAEVRQHGAITRDRSFLDLTGHDDYLSVVSKLGLPGEERRQAPYRALFYPGRKFTVILMGADPAAATYIGTMDANWKPIHSGGLASGGSTPGLLRGLRRF